MRIDDWLQLANIVLLCQMIAVSFVAPFKGKKKKN